ncbi:MAG: hybrid sensor histidine kinase/response regulator [Candidatus Omnitrophica bacterium]|nr:hybrid sensor histidine kinase/response regulator [Candidatus Omnitrophota bacterium]MDE2223100.1 hybrid sensor histidine kinase/response regulator [Candidatus Omnitrophota bacterium]
MKEINVLFLDDEQNVLNAVNRIFMDEPYGVAVARNAQEAMDIMQREKIKVVLSDQRMPDISGIEFLHQIKVQYPDVVRILFTAYADLFAAEAAINISEVYRFINKPWHPEELKTAVATALHYHDMIMENRRLFEEMKVKNEELRQANSRLQVLYDLQKEFSSTLSHELRTPLASIKAAIDIVIGGSAGATTPEQKDFLGRAKANIDRLNRLINNILDLAHMESGKAVLDKKSGDMNKVIRSVAETQESVARSKGLYLTVSLDPRLPPLAFDHDMIIQVLNNLIANAIKFTDAGGITVSSHTDEGRHQLEVRVTDTGRGIDQEDTSKLFEKFQQLGQAHERHAGTGLGLAICKEIIRQHGGKVGVKSQKGEGSCFYFILPVF